MSDLPLPAVPAHRFYYLHNFRQALDWVRECHADLLRPQEQDFIAQFTTLSQPSQALLVRLLMRKGPWFRVDRLAYEEIGPVTAAAEPLLALGWLDADHPMTLAEWFALHTKAELLSQFPQAGWTATWRKEAMAQSLAAQALELRAPSQWCGQAPRHYWRLMVGETGERLKLLFFGNLRQDWSEFVLADLGIFQYEHVLFEAGSRAFQCQEDVDCYLFLHRCREALQEQGPSDVLQQQVLSTHSANPWLQQRRDRLLWRLGQAWERMSDWLRAEAAYAASAYPEARHRRIRVYERQAQWHLAWELAQQALHAPRDEEELQRVRRMLPRLGRALGRPVRKEGPVPVQEDTDLLHLTLPQSPLRVEQAVQRHWSTPQAPVFYVENTLVNAVFGLLCWPAIFAPVPGAFFHPFQTGPADLLAPDFVSRRARLWQACLAELEDGRYRETVRARYTEKQGVQSPFVWWGALPPQLLELALQCIPAAHWRLLFARLLQDLRSNRTGLPDLIRFWPAEGRYAMVEVKGPGDKLQDNQIRWLQYGAANGLPMQVCHVQWQEQDTRAGAH